jgi:hypothetical protein
MTGDFAADIEAALNAHLGDLRNAAAAARQRIDDGIDALASYHGQTAPLEPISEPQEFDAEPLAFGEESTPRPAVDFSLDEDVAAVDHEGIPLPEENS